MSHVVAGSVIVTDLDLLRAVIAKHFPKLKWMEGQKTYNWYGSWMDDYAAKDAAYKQGIDVKDYGKCEHALRMEGVEYEIGIVKRRDGKGHSLVWDFFGDGKKLSNCIGDGAEKLMIEYSKEYVNKFGSEFGFIQQEMEDEEFLYVELTQ